MLFRPGEDAGPLGGIAPRTALGKPQRLAYTWAPSSLPESADMIRITAFCLGMLLAVGASDPAAAQGSAAFSSLEERMSHADFKAAGLDKLTPEELAALNEWLRQRGEAAAVAAPAA